MSRRHLRPEEAELWRKVTETTQRLQAERRHKGSALMTVKKPPHGRIQEQRSLERFDLGMHSQNNKPTHDLAPSIRDHVASAPLAMDKKTFGKLKRGKVAPEAKLDLHGLTLDQAQPALTRFILRAQSSGKRLVLVVTGKGKHRDDGGPIPTRLGVLRHNVPQWLAQPPLSQAVLQVSEAHLRHGGGGAYYVYLRRNR